MELSCRKIRQSVCARSGFATRNGRPCARLDYRTQLSLPARPSRFSTDFALAFVCRRPANLSPTFYTGPLRLRLDGQSCRRLHQKLVSHSDAKADGSISWSYGRNGSTTALQHHRGTGFPSIFHLRAARRIIALVHPYPGNNPLSRKIRRTLAIDS